MSNNASQAHFAWTRFERMTSHVNSNEASYENLDDFHNAVINLIEKRFTETTVIESERDSTPIIIFRIPNDENGKPLNEINLQHVFRHFVQDTSDTINYAGMKWVSPLTEKTRTDNWDMSHVINDHNAFLQTVQSIRSEGEE